MKTPDYRLKFISFFSGLVFFAPVALLLRTSKGISVSEFFILQMILSIGIFIFEVPTGIIADKIGYKCAIVVSQTSVLITRILFLLANNFWIFVLEAVVEALAICFSSGTSSAYMYSLYGEEDFIEKSTKIGKYDTIGFIISTLLYPFIYSEAGMGGLIIATAIGSGIALMCSFGLPRVENKEDEVVSLEKFNKRFSIKVLYILLHNGIITLAWIVINFFYVVKIEEVGWSAQILASMILGYSLIELMVPKLVKMLKKVNQKLRLLIVVSINGILFLNVFILQHEWVILVMLLMPTALSVYGVLIGKLENEWVDSCGLERQRATMLSLFNMGSAMIEIIFLGVSAVVSTTSMMPFLIVAICLLTVASLTKRLQQEEVNVIQS